MAGVGFAGTLSADLESDAGGEATAGLLEHAARTPRKNRYGEALSSLASLLTERQKKLGADVDSCNHLV
jgi:hypothetical protein